ncbi:hypothetical protein CY658_03265 [Variovorax sp. RO1]|uniref:hypothetical protein n=1 Tax=Variovorax sp. RO1 TaxID=2066034 RepID=UPI000C716744|nr:hypothetical protein [Variovorax sp. RO1]PLC06074.1 hypothetical protein CY658_03265 [Variovorax sp. RO1]
MLKQARGNQVTDSILKTGCYEAVIGLAASDPALLELARKYNVRKDDLVDFRDTPKAAPQDIPCNRPIEAHDSSFDQVAPPTETSQLFGAAVQKYAENGLSAAVMLTWTRWRIQVASTIYESRRIYDASIAKPSDQRKEFTTFQTALHRVMRGLEADVLAPRLDNDSPLTFGSLTAADRSPSTRDRASREALYNAHIAVSKHVIEHLLRESAKVEKKLRAARAPSGAPKQPERQTLVTEIVTRLGKFGKTSKQTREKDANAICSMLGVQGRFNAVDERLDSDPKVKVQSTAKRRTRSPPKQPTAER